MTTKHKNTYLIFAGPDENQTTLAYWPGQGWLVTDKLGVYRHQFDHLEHALAYLATAGHCVTDLIVRSELADQLGSGQ